MSSIETFLEISVDFPGIAEYRSHSVNNTSANAMHKTTSATRQN